ncbi:MAG: HIT domain-containing protein [Candidatus Cloacimonetes bacterium]|jgi:ATP adenylyltransferase|nr:HIT domain-containing protein [Candidatus Cloacimonadota bacterium]
MTDGYLYSPWRLDYIQGEKPEDCVLCRFRETGRDTENLIVFRGKHCYVMLNRYPYNNGHIMLVPYLHAKTLGELPPAVMTELGRLLQSSEQALTQAYNCDGINIGINLGRAAGAGIDEHLHIHLVPRWNGDCNFMSVVGGKRVIPEAFEITCERLRQAFANLPGQE